MPKESYRPEACSAGMGAIPVYQVFYHEPPPPRQLIRFLLFSSAALLQQLHALPHVALTPTQSLPVQFDSPALSLAGLSCPQTPELHPWTSAPHRRSDTTAPQRVH